MVLEIKKGLRYTAATGSRLLSLFAGDLITQFIMQKDERGRCSGVWELYGLCIICIHYAIIDACEL